MTAAVAGLELTSDLRVRSGTPSVDGDQLIGSLELGANRQPPLRSSAVESMTYQGRVK